MKYLLVIALILAALVGAWLWLFPSVAGVGEQVPAFSLRTMHDQPMTEADLAGKRTCMIFVSLEDEKTREVFPFLRSLREDCSNVSGLEFVLVFVDGKAPRISLYMSQFPFTGPVLVDQNAILRNALRVRNTPTVILFNTKREITYVTSSWTSEGLAPVARTLQTSP